MSTAIAPVSSFALCFSATVSTRSVVRIAPVEYLTPGRGQRSANRIELRAVNLGYLLSGFIFSAAREDSGPQESDRPA